MKLPNSAHYEQPWRIHEIADDFDLVDVWALRTPGGRDDFDRLVQLMTSMDPETRAPFLVRILFGVRRKLGELLRWDDPDSGLGSRVASLRDRLPSDLRERPSDSAFAALPAAPVYRTDDEFAAEVANKTVHGVIHLGWVPDDDGTFRGQMAILVKPNGLFGSAYVAAIAPFRYLVVYPALLGEIERAWSDSRDLLSRR